MLTAMSSAQNSAPQTIRSFVRRAGRVTSAQRRALADLWPTYGIDYAPAIIDLAECFGNEQPVTLEIGFGNGELLVEMAQRHPDQNFIGVEVHEPGVGHCLLGIEANELANVRLVCHDAMQVLAQQIADNSLSAVNLFFPDPWPKKRHHKRRIVQPDFLQLVSSKLRATGILHVATDWANYAEHIQLVATKEQSLTFASDRRGERPTTKFETRGERLGHAIFDLCYVRNSSTKAT